MLGVLGGLGPAATADFLAKVVWLTPARCDQEHLPIVVWCQPRTPDRTAAILGTGPSPLPEILDGLGHLLRAGARAVAIPCNSSHHWHGALQAASPVPVLHIADAVVAALAKDLGPVLILGTRGTRASGFYPLRLSAARIPWRVPGEALQAEIDGTIAAVKGGETARAAKLLKASWSRVEDSGARTVILGCTELPLAAELLPPPPFRVVDSTLELARAAVAYFRGG